MATPIFLFANQRSGTNFLRNVLVSTGDFVDLNEIFQAGEPSLYWDHFRDEIENNVELAVPTKDNQRYLFNSFLEKYVYGLSERYALIDVKYNSVHNLNSEFQQIHSPAFLLELIKSSNCYVLHLIRYNSLEVHISNVLANKTRIYTANKDAKIERTEIDLDPAGTITEIHKHQLDIKNFRFWLSNMKYENYLEVIYEDLKQLNTDSESYISEKLKQFFRIDPETEFSVLTQKIAKRPEEFVVNYESEIKPYLLSSDYAKFVV